MIRFASRFVLWLVPFGLYAASPFATAWILREAIKEGHTPTIDRLIDWDRVRPTLRASMTSLALNRPIAASLIDDANASPPAATGWWQRFKGYLGASAVDQLIERYANAQGLPQLFTYGQTYRRIVQGHQEPEKTLANLPERFRAFWSRIRHVEFLTPALFEIEMEDKFDPTRRYTGIFTFTEWRWQLTGLYVHTEANPLGRYARIAAARHPLER